MENGIANYKDSGHELSSGNEMYLDVEKFEQAQRVAKMLASSTMVPDHFKNNVGNCMIGLNFASRVGLDPFMVLQKMYVIHGRPGIEAQLMIALINRSGRFSPLKFRLAGEKETLECTCYATEAGTGEECSQKVTWGIVKAEGWDKKTGSKWKTMPELMLQYRSATFFGRLYCPEALLGMMTKEELYDVGTPSQIAPTKIADRIKPLKSIHGKPTNEELPNPLHLTNEWAKYKEACEVSPDIAGTLPEPKTIEQCLQAVNQITQALDEQNA